MGNSQIQSRITSNYRSNSLTQSKVFTESNKNINFEEKLLNDSELRSLSKTIETIDENSIEINLKKCKITEIGIRYFLDAVRKRNKKIRIEILNLAQNKIGDNGTILISKVLKMSECRELYIEKNKIEFAGAVHVGKSLINNRFLTILDISFNNIMDGGAKYIGLGLEKNQFLKKLILSHNSIENEGIKYISEGLKKSNLQYLNISKNNIGSQAMMFISNALEYNKSLVYLNVFGNERIGTKGAKYLFQCLKKNKTLKKIIMSNCGIDDFISDCISKCFEYNFSVTSLDLISDIDLSKQTKLILKKCLQRNQKMGESLLLCIEKNNLSLFKKLLKKGVNPTKKNKKKNNIFHSIVLFEREKFLESLISILPFQYLNVVKDLLLEKKNINEKTPFELTEEDWFKDKIKNSDIIEINLL